jgi:hypothetical protein
MEAHDSTDELTTLALEDAIGGAPMTPPPTEKMPITSMQKLLLRGTITEEEYQKLLNAEKKFREEEARGEELEADSRLEAIFGESWEDRCRRMLGPDFEGPPARPRSFSSGPSSPGTTESSTACSSSGSSNNNYSISSAGIRTDGGGASDGDGDTSAQGPVAWPRHDLRVFIAKTNDDLRQEVCCLQLMELCWEILQFVGLHRDLYLRPYRIISTGNSTGLVEVITDAMSLDALKKTPGFTTLPEYFSSTYGTSRERLADAKRNFCSSLAAYSLFCYILLIKDRHNGNMLISSAGHIIHIDFGFMLSIAPGGAFSMETCPFKLTDEMVDCLDGLESPLFNEFVKVMSFSFLGNRHLQI